MRRQPQDVGGFEPYTRVRSTASLIQHRDLFALVEFQDFSLHHQGKKLVERCPFLTGLLGPLIVRKLFGR